MKLRLMPWNTVVDTVIVMIKLELGDMNPLVLNQESESLFILDVCYGKDFLHCLILHYKIL